MAASPTVAHRCRAAAAAHNNGLRGGGALAMECPRNRHRHGVLYDVTTANGFTDYNGQERVSYSYPMAAAGVGHGHHVKVPVGHHHHHHHHQPSSTSGTYLVEPACTSSSSSTTNLTGFFRNKFNGPKTAGNKLKEVGCSASTSDGQLPPPPPLTRHTNSAEKSTAGAEDETETSERVKTKLLSVWNNVKYGWTVRIKTNFSRTSPIWFLGQCYHHKVKDEVDPDSTYGLALGMEGFRQDFISRIWLTYRREFPTLAGSAYTTDCGWGCMLRSGQMMLAQALVYHLLGRGWRWQSSIGEAEEMHRKIIGWFGDYPAKCSPFSLHRLVNIGESSGKRAGDWYGPASVAHILKKCVESSSADDPCLNDVCVYVAEDCTVYREDVVRLCSGAGDDWKGVVILVPARLGGEVLNPIYFSCVQAILSNEYCIGIIGGRPKHSLYFVGWQEDKFIHLDPHYCQEAVDVRIPDFPLQSFHCMSPRKLSFSRMDPSCTIGFYCRTKADVWKFLASCNEVLTPPHPQADYPVFVVLESKEHHQLASNSLVQSLHFDESRFAMDTTTTTAAAASASDDEDYEEFVFL